MISKKKVLILACVFMVSLLSACSSKNAMTNKEEGDKSSKIEVKNSNKETTPISNKESIVSVSNNMPSNEINEYIGFNMNSTEIREFNSKGKTYILILAGRQNTGGYNLKLDKITKEGDLYNINVVLSEPEENMMTTQVISRPTLLLQKNTNSKLKVNLIKKDTIVKTKTID